MAALYVSDLKRVIENITDTSQVDCNFLKI